MEVLVGVDPGREKCGVAVLTLAGEVVERRVVPAARVGAVLREVAERYAVEAVILGDRTGEEAVARQLEAAGIRTRVGRVVRVDEHLSSQEARRLFWQYTPRRGWRRLVPPSMLTPPEPVDGFVAEVLVRRYLAKETGHGRGQPGKGDPENRR